ncbi:hypothetical protein DV736_g6669, partial [Chaetothyriales sp. CBS 134916]
MASQAPPPKLPENVFRQILASRNAKEVPMGEYKIMVFSSNDKFLSTRNMNSCSGLAIISQKAVLLAHIKPMDPKILAKEGKTAGQSYTEHIMGLIQQAFLGYKQYFPSDSPAVVVSSVHNGIIALEDQRTIIFSVLKTMNFLNTVNVLYTTRQTAQAKTAAGIYGGTIIVAGPGALGQRQETDVSVEG